MSARERDNHRGLPLPFGSRATQVIVLRGPSSSGKTGIARCPKAILSQPWISIDHSESLECARAIAVQVA